MKLLVSTGADRIFAILAAFAVYCITPTGHGPWTWAGTGTITALVLWSVREERHHGA